MRDTYHVMYQILSPGALTYKNDRVCAYRRIKLRGYDQWQFSCKKGVHHLVPDKKKKKKKSGGHCVCNRPVSHSARNQRPARERHIMRIASRENVDNQAPRNANFTQ